MKAARVASRLCVGLAVALLAGTLADTEARTLAAAALGMGALWGMGAWRGWRWSDDVTFVGVVVLAASGILVGTRTPGLVAAVLLVLAGWDLGRWCARVGESLRVEGELDLLRKHVYRLGGGLLLGGVLSGLALNLRVGLRFGGALLLGLLMILASRWLLGALRES